MRALYVAATGMSAQQTRIDVVANNLANVNTTGFKKSRGAFEDAFYQELTYGGTGPSTARLDLGNGVQLSGLEKDHSDGALVETGDPLDVAIRGGYLVVEDQYGTRFYTRDGDLSQDADGTLITSGGLFVSGNIQVPEDAEQLEITKDGTVQARLFGDTDPTVIGQFEVATFINPAGLQPMGNNVFAETPASGEALLPELGSEVQVVQGQLESSNVDVAQELIQMILAQRAYELNSKVIQAADETLQITANLRR